MWRDLHSNQCHGPGSGSKCNETPDSEKNPGYRVPVRSLVLTNSIGLHLQNPPIQSVPQGILDRVIGIEWDMSFGNREVGDPNSSTTGYTASTQTFYGKRKGYQC